MHIKEGILLSRVQNRMRNYISRFLFPRVCVGCSCEGSWLCEICVHKVEQAPAQVAPQGIDELYAVSFYHDICVQKLIHMLKYQGAYDVGSAFGDLLHAVFSQRAFPSCDVIVPVPLHARKKRERGFNQAHVIAQQLGMVTGIPVRCLLSRTVYTVSQTKLTRQQRIRNIKNAFVGVPSKLHGNQKTAVLVDDVTTTGSTLAECACVLREIGFKSVYAVVIAKER